MRWVQGLLAGILGVLFFAAPASAQVIGLLVGNQQSFNGIDGTHFRMGFIRVGLRVLVHPARRPFTISLTDPAAIFTTL
jgi:hypothetical protein